MDKRSADSIYLHLLVGKMQAARGKNNKEASSYAKEAIAYSRNSPMVYTGKSYVMLALIYADYGLYDSAAYCFQEAEKITQIFKDDYNLASIYQNGMGLLHKKIGNNEKALYHYKRVADYGEAGLGQENLAGNFLNIANVYTRMGNRKEAIQNLYKGLKIFESVGSRKGMSYCYNNLGALLLQQGNNAEASVYLKKSLAMKEKDGDIKGVTVTCNELGVLYTQLKDYKSALTYLTKAIDLSEQLNYKEMLITALINKGRVYRHLKEYDLALNTFANVKPLAEETPNHSMLSFLQAEQGKLYAELKDNDQAISQLLESLQKAKNTTNQDAHLNALLFLTEAYTQNKQYKQALEFNQQYHALLDSIQSNQLKLEYRELANQYEVEKKNSEIELLKKDRQLQHKILEQQRAVQIGIGIAFISFVIIALLIINRYRIINRSKRLLEIERVRNTIARDLHDDIGSTLSSINIITQLAIKTNTSNGSSQDHFKKIGEQSSMIMERMSDIVWSINPNNDSLSMMGARIREFTAEILEPKDIQYSFQGFDSLNGEVIEIEKRKNLFLIFKEALNNAAKYSGASAVEISLIQKQEDLILGIRDNGNGFDPELARKGNGLRNIKQRANAINGQIDIETAPGKGTSILLQVPIT